MYTATYLEAENFLKKNISLELSEREQNLHKIQIHIQ